MIKPPSKYDGYRATNHSNAETCFKMYWNYFDHIATYSFYQDSLHGLCVIAIAQQVLIFVIPAQVEMHSLLIHIFGKGSNITGLN